MQHNHVNTPTRLHNLHNLALYAVAPVVAMQIHQNQVQTFVCCLYNTMFAVRRCICLLRPKVTHHAALCALA